MSGKTLQDIVYFGAYQLQDIDVGKELEQSQNPENALKQGISVF